MARTKAPASSPTLNHIAERIGETLGTVVGRAESLKADGANVIAEAQKTLMTGQAALFDLGHDAAVRGAEVLTSAKRVVAAGKATAAKAKQAVSRSAAAATKGRARSGAAARAKKVATKAARTARKAVKRAAPKAKAAARKGKKVVKAAAKSLAKAGARAKAQFRKGRRKR